MVNVGQVPSHHILGHDPYLAATDSDFVVWSIRFVSSVSFIWLNQTDQMN
jgi:hypothetical protein